MPHRVNKRVGCAHGNGKPRAGKRARVPGRVSRAARRGYNYKRARVAGGVSEVNVLCVVKFI